MKLFLCGDVMMGRGIDQALPHPADPVLYEPAVRDARDYLELAQRAHGQFRQPIRNERVWGDALAELALQQPDARIINLETTITDSEDHWPKEVCYKMGPGNVGVLTAAQVDCCCLANNHMLDWGYGGLSETLAALDAANIRHAGAGENLEQAAAPAIWSVPDKGRIVVFSAGSPSSGVPYQWAAEAKKPGVWLVEESKEGAELMARHVQQVRQEGDVVVVSIHWGSNWGYDITDEQVRFAHYLIDNGANIVYGHSSHHVKGLEVYANGLILYGCGDFINDYEGIGGFRAFRPDLALMYMPTIDPTASALADLELVALKMRRLHLKYAGPTDARWLYDLLGRLSVLPSGRLELEGEHTIHQAA